MRSGHQRVIPQRRRSRFLWFLAIVIVFASALTSSASAQDAVWAPRAEQQSAPWFSAARTALESQGVVVHVVERGAGCSTVGLALRLAQELGSARALCLELTHDGATDVLKLRLLRSPSQIGEGSAQVEHGDIAAAVREAYQLADVALDLGDAGLLRVITTPEGALVALDGEPIGHAPLDKRLPPGKHDVNLTLDGFGGQHQSVDVERGRVSEVRAKLVRGADSELFAPAATKASPLNWIIGGALVLAAAPALVLSLNTLARDGSCADEDASSHCTERVQFGTRSAVLLGVGSAALLGGAYFMLLQPLTLQVSASSDHAYVVLRAAL
jgi:hypothetical protein